MLMLANKFTPVTLLKPGAKANTAAATSAWINVSKYYGDMIVLVAVGVITAGTLTVTFQQSENSDGTDPVALVPTYGGAFTVVSTTNDDPFAEVRLIRAGTTRKYIQLVGTIATGPADVCAMLFAQPRHIA